MICRVAVRVKLYSEAVPVLAAALNDEEPLIRGHAAWALGRIGGEAAMQALRGREAAAEDAWVREEVELALRGPSGGGTPGRAPRS